MRPVRLTLKGFGTFRELTTIDFDGVDLAAFVGATGSGKSTIIDGIAFALYGSVPRYEDGRKVAPAISSLASEARVRLEFEIAGIGYSATRVVRRTATGASTKEARLECGDVVITDKSSDVTHEVERLLGLNFDRFTRTVVLPQGKFAAFLHDEPRERQALLRELLHLGVYEQVGQVARKNAASDRVRVDELERQLSGQERLAEADVDRLAAIATDAAQIVEQAKRLVANHESALASHRDQTGLAHDFGVLALAFAGLSIPPTARTIASELRARADELTAADEAQGRAERKTVEAESAVGEGPDLAAAQEGRRQRARLVDLSEQTSQAEAQVIEAEAVLHAAQQAAEQVRADQQRMLAARTAAREQLDRAEVALRDGPDTTHLARVQEQRRNRDALATTLPQLLDQVSTAKAALDAASGRLEEAQAAARNSQATYQRARELAGVSALIENLREGDRCPVCQQTVEAVPEHDPDEELRRATRTKDTAETVVGDCTAAVKATSDAHLMAEAESKRVQNDLDSIDAALESAPSNESIDQQLQSARARAEAVEAARSANAAADQAVRTFEAAPETVTALRAEQVAIAAHAAKNALHAEKERERADLTQVVERVPDEAALDAIIATAEALRVGLDEARQTERVVRASRDRAQAALHAATAAEREARRELSATRDRFVSLGVAELAGEDLAHDWDQLHQWALTKHPEAIELCRQAQAEAAGFERRVDAIRSEIATSLEPLAVEMPEDLTLLDELMIRREVALRQQADQARERLAQQGRDQVRLDELKERAQVAEALGGLLRIDGFERWLLEEVVNDLVERATTYLLVLSNGQFSLVAREAQLKIQDHLNADELRDVKTLSGGETFLASLALALGLGEAIQQSSTESSPTLESVFLDEGFGTLDADSLDSVTTAIEELGASGRMVVIVTHIRELAERMPVRFDVTKGPNTSTVERVEV